MASSSFVSIGTAFFDLVSKRQDLHGMWIPLKFWAYTVSGEIANDNHGQITSYKLRKAIDEALKRCLDLDSISRAKYKGISQLLLTEHRIKQRKQSFPLTKSGTKKQLFLWVVSKHGKRPDTNSNVLNAEQKSLYFRNQYVKYSNLMHPTTAPSLTVNTAPAILKSIWNKKHVNRELSHRQTFLRRHATSVSIHH
jgi:hypothetical protein